MFSQMFNKTKRAAKTLGLLTIGGLASYGTYGLVYGQTNGPKSDLPKLFTTQPDNENQIIEYQTIVDHKYRRVINECRKRMLQWRTHHNVPGFVIGVSVRGQNVWLEGQGYSDLENGQKCHPGTVMRIASISKSITATLLAKMVQDGKIDLDKSIYEYLKDGQFPKKKWEGKDVDITVRQLAAHLGGIRHYKKNDDKKESLEFDTKEYYLQQYFPTVTESLSLFKDDPLVAEPGKKFEYTTFGYTLLSAVMETQMKSKDFAKHFNEFIRNELGLLNTYLDKNDRIIYNRARYYSLDNEDKKNMGRIRNVPFVDNSCKWAGGGLLSTIPDLLKYGNIMLYSFIGTDRQGRQGYLTKDITDEMWKPYAHYDDNNLTKGYGIGFSVIRDGQALRAFTAEPPFSTIASHSGGAVGATSMLIIEPSNELIVAIIANLQSAGDIHAMALDIAKRFADAIQRNNKSTLPEQKEIRELLLLTK